MRRRRKDPPKKKIVKKTKLAKNSSRDDALQDLKDGDLDPDNFDEKDLRTMIQMNDPALWPNTNLSNASFLKELKQFENKLRDWKPKTEPRPRRLTMAIIMEKCLDPSVLFGAVEASDGPSAIAEDDAIDPGECEDLRVKGVLGLQILRLDRMNISIIDDIECLTEVKQAYFQHNVISKIEGFDFMLSLTVLDLSYNNISVIENISDLPLEVLNLSYNKIHRIDVAELPVETLRYLRLEGNPCKEYKEDIMAVCDNLVELDGQACIQRAATPPPPLPPPALVGDDDEGEDIVGSIEIAPQVKTHTSKVRREAMFTQVEHGLRRRHEAYDALLAQEEDETNHEDMAPPEVGDGQLPPPPPPPTEAEDDDEEEDSTVGPESSSRPLSAQRLKSAVGKDELRLANVHHTNVAKLALEEKWASMQMRCRARKDEISQRNEDRRLKSLQN